MKKAPHPPGFFITAIIGDSFRQLILKLGQKLLSGRISGLSDIHACHCIDDQVNGGSKNQNLIFKFSKIEDLKTLKSDIYHKN